MSDLKQELLELTVISDGIVEAFRLNACPEVVQAAATMLLVRELRELRKSNSNSKGPSSKTDGRLLLPCEALESIKDSNAEFTNWESGFLSKIEGLIRNGQTLTNKQISSLMKIHGQYCQ